MEELQKLKEFFNSAELKGTAVLYPGTTVINVSLFIESHFEVLENGGNKPLHDVFYERLLRLKEILLEKRMTDQQLRV